VCVCVCILFIVYIRSSICSSDILGVSIDSAAIRNGLPGMAIRLNSIVIVCKPKDVDK
jgi:hypothetical protein